MASVSTLRDRLKVLLDDIDGLFVYDDWPDSFHAPGAIVLPIETEHELTFGTTDMSLFQFEIVVAVAQASPLKISQEALDGYTSNTGTNSVRTAIAVDRTLGGQAHGVFWQPWTRPDIEPINGVEYLGQRLPLKVYAS